MPYGIGKQGGTVIIAAKFYSNGTLADPDTMNDVAIYDAQTGGNLVVGSLTPTKVATGIYEYEWTIPSDQASGRYWAQWNSIWGTETMARREWFDVDPDYSSRYAILVGLQTILGQISTDAGYEFDVKTTAIEAREWDDSMSVNANTMPWIGIVPQIEQWNQKPGAVFVDWPIHVIMHIQSSGSTMAAVASDCAKMRADIYKAIYKNYRLGVDGVIRTWITGGAGSEGAPSAAEEQRASVKMLLMVRFQERHPT